VAYQIGTQSPQGALEISKRAIFYAILIGYSIMTAIPFIWALLTSFKTNAEASQRFPTLFPAHPSLAAWTGQNGVFSAAFPTYFRNSVIVACVSPVAASCFSWYSAP
jgi:ABC-type glycerol-3-phosphate transport system permease component